MRSDSSWSEEAKLTASDGAANDWFGGSVSVSGDTAVVVAPWDDDNGTGSGSAYVFVRSGSSWIEQDKLIASDGAAGDHFGSSVSVSGDTAVVGASYDDYSGAYTGSAYVFDLSPMTGGGGDGGGGGGCGAAPALALAALFLVRVRMRRGGQRPLSW